MKKYSVIYADPPWQYHNKPQGKGPEDHYQTMPLEDICALPVKELADKDCALFMWVTLPFLRDCFKVIDAWGFKYKTVAFVWIKQNRVNDSIFWGMGMWTRSNAEICILAVKGNPKRTAANVHQVIISHVQEHSRKPNEARLRIEALMGDVPRIELFARESPPGWDVWGNEVNSDINMQA